MLAAAIFGLQWQGHLIPFSVDKMSVVHVVNSTYSKDPHLMHMIRVLVFLAAYFNFWFRAEHIRGKCNDLTDALSRNNLDYPSLESSSDHSPDIPASLMALVGRHSGLDISSLDSLIQSIPESFVSPSKLYTC